MRPRRAVPDCTLLTKGGSPARLCPFLVGISTEKGGIRCYLSGEVRKLLILLAGLGTALVVSACSTSPTPYPTLSAEPQASDVTARCIDLGRIDASGKEVRGARPLPSDAPLRSVIAADEMAGTYPVYLYDALCASRQGFTPYSWLIDALPPSYDLAQIGYVAAVYPPSGDPTRWVRIRGINVPGVDSATFTQ